MRQADETGGLIPGTTDAPAFSLWRSKGHTLPVMVAVPHDGRCYPAGVLSALRAPGKAALRLEDRHVSEIGHRIALALDITFLVAEAPRAMIDLNRSTDDVDWGMVVGSKPRSIRHSLVNRRARNGLGLIPRRIPGLGEIWRGPVTRDEIDGRIDHIYTPYHSTLARELERLRDRHGAALLIDLHSMPPLRPSEPHQKTAEFVFGDRYGASCDGGLVDLAMRYMSGAGRRVSHNRPYSGGHMLDKHGQPARGIHAVQLEVCRSLYLDSRFDQPSARLPMIARLLTGLTEALGNEVSQMGRPTRIAHAAE